MSLPVELEVLLSEACQSEHKNKATASNLGILNLIASHTPTFGHIIRKVADNLYGDIYSGTFTVDKHGTKMRNRAYHEIYEESLSMVRNLEDQVAAVTAQLNVSRAQLKNKENLVLKTQSSVMQFKQKCMDLGNAVQKLKVQHEDYVAKSNTRIQKLEMYNEDLREELATKKTKIVRHEKELKELQFFKSTMGMYKHAFRDFDSRMKLTQQRREHRFVDNDDDIDSDNDSYQKQQQEQTRESSNSNGWESQTKADQVSSLENDIIICEQLLAELYLFTNARTKQFEEELELQTGENTKELYRRTFAEELDVAMKERNTLVEQLQLLKIQLSHVDSRNPLVEFRPIEEDFQKRSGLAPHVAREVQIRSDAVPQRESSDKLQDPWDASTFPGYLEKGKEKESEEKNQSKNSNNENQQPINDDSNSNEQDGPTQIEEDNENGDNNNDNDDDFVFEDESDDESDGETDIKETNSKRRDFLKKGANCYNVCELVEALHNGDLSENPLLESLLPPSGELWKRFREIGASRPILQRHFNRGRTECMSQEVLIRKVERTETVLRLVKSQQHVDEEDLELMFDWFGFMCQDFEEQYQLKLVMKDTVFSLLDGLSSHQPEVDTMCGSYVLRSALRGQIHPMLILYMSQMLDMATVHFDEEGHGQGMTHIDQIKSLLKHIYPHKAGSPAMTFGSSDPPGFKEYSDYYDSPLTVKKSIEIEDSKESVVNRLFSFVVKQLLNGEEYRTSAFKQHLTNRNGGNDDDPMSSSMATPLNGGLEFDQFTSIILKICPAAPRKIISYFYRQFSNQPDEDIPSRIDYRSSELIAAFLEFWVLRL
eukprot:TRINITY_DN7697_c0_g1_i1.p1 TRINITY_DN7697_c0_g1~~TRINITY_DN7697_c0_g1_i1.p1  ORF type:complete len:825 (-),score=238.98 TRINITY_DN7697_c0_g1_i1:202-2676(-)